MASRALDTETELAQQIRRQVGPRIRRDWQHAAIRHAVAIETFVESWRHQIRARPEQWDAVAQDYNAHKAELAQARRLLVDTLRGNRRPALAPELTTAPAADQPAVRGDAAPHGFTPPPAAIPRAKPGSENDVADALVVPAPFEHDDQDDTDPPASARFEHLDQDHVDVAPAVPARFGNLRQDDLDPSDAAPPRSDRVPGPRIPVSLPRRVPGAAVVATVAVVGLIGVPITALSPAPNGCDQAG